MKLRLYFQEAPTLVWPVLGTRSLLSEHSQTRLRCCCHWTPHGISGFLLLFPKKRHFSAKTFPKSFSAISTLTSFKLFTGLFLSISEQHYLAFSFIYLNLHFLLLNKAPVPVLAYIFTCPPCVLSELWISSLHQPGALLVLGGAQQTHACERGSHLSP